MKDDRDTVEDRVVGNLHQPTKDDRDTVGNENDVDIRSDNGKECNLCIYMYIVALKKWP